MSSETHIGMHREHVTWHKEDDFWRDDLAIWQSEIEHVIEDMPRMEMALREHAELLRKHAASIRLNEQRYATHEHTLVNYEQGEAPQELIELARSHEEEAEQHVTLRWAHDDFKKRQHTLMANWRLLLRALVKAESAAGCKSLK